MAKKPPKKAIEAVDAIVRLAYFAGWLWILRLNITNPESFVHPLVHGAMFALVSGVDILGVLKALPDAAKAIKK